ncbi:hypothetical protein ACTFIU_001682 [Dictyostelium citrinum]
MADFYNINIGEIFPNSNAEIYSVHSDYPVKDAFELMIKKKILSLPVYDTKTRKYNKFIDMLDIVSFCINHFSQKELSELDLNFILESKEIFQKYKIGDICDLSGRNGYYPVESTAPLKIGIDLMTKWGVHRLPIIDSEGSLISILTQSRVVEYIQNHIQNINGLDKAIGQLKDFGTSSVISIKQDRMVIDAFKLMHENGISAVPVVNQIGVLVGNISVSDMKMVGYDGTLFSRMFLPIESFLEMKPKNQNIDIFGKVLCVLDSTTIEEIITKFYISKVHRLYKVDLEGRPSAVISQGDLLKYFA